MPAFKAVPLRDILEIHLNSNSFFSYIEIVAIAFLLILGSLSPSSADMNAPGGDPSVLTISADQQFAFAERYFASDEYYRAIGEYERFIHFFPEDTRLENAMHRIGLAYYRGQQYPDAIMAFRKLIESFQETDLSINAYMMISECHARLNRLARSLANLHDLISLTDDPDVKDEANYRIGWIYLERAAWDKARSYLDKISPANRSKYRLQRLSAELEGESGIDRKEPKLAGFISILPGAGYAYLGRYRDALTAFLLNGGLIYAAATAFTDDNPALGGVISFIGSGFYFGNIFGAVSGAHKYNRNQTTGFVERLKANTKIHLSADYKRQGVLVSLKFAF
jgi:tetratricopeptide (TPR) repeat protein